MTTPDESYDDLTVTAEVAIGVAVTKPYTKEDVIDVVQSELGHTGAVVLEVSY